jgi:glycerol kinase
MAAYLVSALTGSEAVADPVNASRTLLWNLATRDWDPGLCRHFGLDVGWLPRCVPSRHAFGALGEHCLPAGSARVPVEIVTGDLSAAAFARGGPRADTLYITLGTGAFMQRVEDGVVTPHPRLLNGVLWHDGHEGLYSLEGTVNGAGSALAWYAGHCGEDTGVVLDRIEDYDPGVESLPLFLNGVSGLGSPYWIADFESRFLGDTDPVRRSLAVVESVAFLLMTNYEAMASVMPAPEHVVVSGGLSSNDGLCRALAALTGRPVERSAEPEGTAKGLAYLLAGMPADWTVRAGEAFEPAPAPGLHRRYREWTAALSGALPG